MNMVRSRDKVRAINTFDALKLVVGSGCQACRSTAYDEETSRLCLEHTTWQKP